METNYLTPLLMILFAVLIVILGFSIYGNLNPEIVKEKNYSAEEIIEPEIPDETAEIPVMEEAEEEVELLGNVEIEIKEWKFYPSEVTISPGTTVTWINKDRVPHKVVAFDRVFYGTRLNPGDKYSFTFTNEGTHSYFDAVFTKSGRGKIIVQKEPLPVTGGVVGINLSGKKNEGMFALLVILFVVMTVGLSHGIYSHYKI